MPEPQTEVGCQEKTLSINELRDFLQGTWKLDRQIFDHRRSETGRLVGEARFLPQDESLVYREAGVLTLDDQHDRAHKGRAHKGRAHQSYRYDFVSSARAEVRFTDGRFFHDLDLSNGVWACTHLCGDDRYEGAFTALDRDSWRVVWSVRGPRKDLRLDSHYSRAL